MKKLQLITSSVFIAFLTSAGVAQITPDHYTSKKKCVINQKFSTTKFLKRVKASGATNTIVEYEEQLNTENKTSENAEYIPNFRTNKDGANTLKLKGNSDGKPIEFKEAAQKVVKETLLDANDSFETAVELNFEDNPFSAIVASFSGDGPQGQDEKTSKDYDFYKFTLNEGDLLISTIRSTIDPANPESTDPGFFPVFALISSSGELLNEPQTSFQTIFTAKKTDDYFLVVADFETIFNNEKFNTFNFQLDPDKRTLGNNKGSYTLNVSKEALTTDYYSIDLEKDDVIAVSSDAENIVGFELLNSEKKNLISSLIAAPFEFPDEASQIDNAIEAGDSFINYVIPKSGRYTIGIKYLNTFFLEEGDNLDGKSIYNTTIVATTPRYKIRPGTKEVVYLNFNGATYNPDNYKSIERSPILEENKDEVEEGSNIMLPLKDLLEDLSLENTPNMAATLAFKIVQNVKQTYANVNLTDPNPDYHIEFISDYGDENLAKKIVEILKTNDTDYSSVFIGSGVKNDQINRLSLGITNFVDPGNFSINDGALVYASRFLFYNVEDGSVIENSFLTDLTLSDPALLVDLIAASISTTVSHEIGHYIGLDHTDNAPGGIVTIMDTNSSIPQDVGLNIGDEFTNDKSKISNLEADSYETSQSLFGTNLLGLNVRNALGYIPTGNADDSTIQEIDQLQNNFLNNLANNTLSNTLFALNNNSHQLYSYPNPQSKNQSVDLVIPTDVNGKVSITLYNLAGAKILDAFNGIVKSKNNGTIKLSLADSNLDSGTYICQIKSTKGILNHKITIK